MADTQGFLLNSEEDEALDKDAILADMQAMADQAGDWKDHLPFEAAVDFFVEDAVREMYGEHVDQCEYCQEMLEALNPSNKILGNLHRVAREELVLVEPSPPAGMRWAPSLAIAAGIAGAFFVGMLVSNQLNDVATQGSPVRDFVSDAPGNKFPTQYGSVDVVAALFSQAKSNLDSGDEKLAYAQFASGFEVAGLDDQFVDAVYIGPALSGEELESALAELGQEQPMMRNDILTAIRLNAAAGKHNEATSSMGRYLALYADDSKAREPFEVLVLQTQERQE